MKTYRLPDRKTTTSTTRYLREWNRLTKPVAKALGCEVIGCDPKVHLIAKGESIGFQISVSVAERIRKLALANSKQ